MTRGKSNQPTEVELQMLAVLWELGPSPVREIHARLSADKGTNLKTSTSHQWSSSTLTDHGFVTLSQIPRTSHDGRWRTSELHWICIKKRKNEKYHEPEALADSIAKSASASGSSQSGS